jgi:hypothetical protein
MSINMSYVKFENTLTALNECAKDWDNPSNEHEAKAKKRLIQLMVDLLSDDGHNVELNEVEEG